MPSVEVVIYAQPEQQLHLGPADGLDGQLQLPREPPFSSIIGVTPAALVTLDLSPDSDKAMRSVRMFNEWYKRLGVLNVIAGDGKVWIRGRMRCVEMEVHEGIQTTVAVPPPIMWATREVLVNGRWTTMRLPYQAQPTFQWIRRDVHRYVLAADVYEFVGPPVRQSMIKPQPDVTGVMVH